MDDLSYEQRTQCDTYRSPAPQESVVTLENGEVKSEGNAALTQLHSGLEGWEES